MAITYGTILAVIVAPVVMVQYFYYGSSGVIWHSLTPFTNSKSIERKINGEFYDIKVFEALLEFLKVKNLKSTANSTLSQEEMKVLKTIDYNITSISEDVLFYDKGKDNAFFGFF